jgi:pescadillo
MLEKQYHDELKMEIDGVTFSNLSNKKADKSPDTMDKDDTKSYHEEDEKNQAEKDSADISTALMSRKKLGLYKAIEVCVLNLIYIIYQHPLIFHPMDARTRYIK